MQRREAHSPAVGRGNPTQMQSPGGGGRKWRPHPTSAPPVLKASLEGSPILSCITSSGGWDTPSNDSDQPSWDTRTRGGSRDNFKFLCVFGCFARYVGSLFPPQGLNPTPPPLEALSLDHWAAREVLQDNSDGQTVWGNWIGGWPGRASPNSPEHTS